MAGISGVRWSFPFQREDTVYGSQPQNCSVVGREQLHMTRESLRQRVQQLPLEPLLCPEEAKVSRLACIYFTRTHKYVHMHHHICAIHIILMEYMSPSMCPETWGALATVDSLTQHRRQQYRPKG